MILQNSQPIAGDVAVLTFHTDHKNQEKGFNITFEFTPDGKTYPADSKICDFTTMVLRFLLASNFLNVLPTVKRNHFGQINN